MKTEKEVKLDFKNFFPNVEKLREKHHISKMKLYDEIMKISPQTAARMRKTLPSTEVIERTRKRFGLKLEEILS